MPQIGLNNIYEYFCVPPGKVNVDKWVIEDWDRIAMILMLQVVVLLKVSIKYIYYKYLYYYKLYYNVWLILEF